MEDLYIPPPPPGWWGGGRASVPLLQRTRSRLPTRRPKREPRPASPSLSPPCPTGSSSPWLLPCRGAHSRGSISVFEGNRRQEGGGHTWANAPRLLPSPPAAPRDGRGPLSSRLTGCQQAGGGEGKRGAEGRAHPSPTVCGPRGIPSRPQGGCHLSSPLGDAPPAGLGKYTTAWPPFLRERGLSAPGARFAARAPADVSADRERPLVCVRGGLDRARGSTHLLLHWTLRLL